MVEMSRKTFTITAERTPTGWWTLVCDGVGVSQVRRLTQAAEDMREPIAYVTGLDADSFDICVVPKLPNVFTEKYEAAKKYKEDADKANEKAMLASKQAAKSLKDQGFTLREIGQVMDISYQRAGQLISM